MMENTEHQWESFCEDPTLTNEIPSEQVQQKTKEKIITGGGG